MAIEHGDILNIQLKMFEDLVYDSQICSFRLKQKFVFNVSIQRGGGVANRSAVLKNLLQKNIPDSMRGFSLRKGDATSHLNETPCSLLTNHKTS